jgi:cytoskeleton protein RodZ
MAAMVGDPPAISAPPAGDELAALSRLLSEARQQQGLSVASLAQRLHMGPEQLLALEAADPARLPEPVFVVAQARRLADALALEIGPQIEALRQSDWYRASRVVPRGEAAAASAPSPDPAQIQQPHPQLQRRPLLAAVVVVLALGGVVAAGLLGRQAEPPPKAPAARPAPAQPQVVHSTSAELVLSASQPSWLEVRPLQGSAVLFRGSFKGERRFPLAQGLRVLAGRPDLVLVSRPGEPARPLGSIQQVSWQRFLPPASGQRPPEPPPPEQPSR